MEQSSTCVAAGRSFPESGLVRLPDVVAFSGFGKTWVYKKVRSGEFPAPVKIGRATAWRAADVRAWLDSLSEA